MSYIHTAGVNPAVPADSDPANVDDDLRAIKLAYNERLDDFFGTNWATDDPIAPTKIGSKVTISSGQIFTSIFDAGLGGSSKTINWNDGDQQRVTLNVSSCVLGFSNLRVGASYFLYINHSGARTLAFPGNVYKSGGTAFGNLLSTGNSIVSLTVYNSGLMVGSILATGLP